MPPLTTKPPAGLRYTTAPEAPTPTVRAPEGVVVAVVSVTGTVDEVNDLIVPGAYTRTLTALTPKVIKEHQWADVVGRVLHIEELMPGDPRLPPFTGRGKPWPADAGALIATMQFNLNTDLGREAFENVRFFGADQQFSIGYKVVPGRTRRRRDGVRVIGDLDLWEISTVLWGAHLDTLALDVKSAKQAAAKADKEMRAAVDDEVAAIEDGDPGAAADAAGDVDQAEVAAEKADEEETDLVAADALTLDVARPGDGVAARKRAAEKLRAAARARARRAKDETTLTEMDRRDEWDRAIDLETLEEQKRRSEYRRKYKLTRETRNRRVDLAEDERVRRATWQAQMSRWVRVEKARRRKWSMTMRARTDALAASIRALEAKTAASLVAEVKGGVPGVADTPEDMAATRRLFRWYEKGEGAALIQWGVDGDFYRCVAIAGKHMTSENAKGFCANRHKGALGTWPGDHDGDGKRDKKTHPADGMEWKTMTQMRGSFEERQRKIERAVDGLLCPRPVDAGDGMAAASGWVSVDATFDTKVYVTVYKDGGVQESYEIPYSFDTEGEVALGEPTEVELSVVARPEGGMEPEPVADETAAQMRYLTPVLTGFGELAVATKTASFGLEEKGGAWKEALADAARTLMDALDEAGVSLDDPDEPVMDDDDLEDVDVDGPAEPEGVPYEETEPVDTDEGEAGDDMGMPGMDESAGFGVLGGDTETDTETDMDTDMDADMDAPMVPDEPGIPDNTDTDLDADDDGETDGMETAEVGAPSDGSASNGDPTADTAEAGDTYASDPDPDEDDDEDEDDDGDKPWKGEKKTLTLDPADIIADLERLRLATS